MVSVFPRFGGEGDRYATWFTETLKPYIDSHYPNLDGFDHTAIAGSYFSGGISAYIAAKYPDVYSHIGIFSLASWINETDLLAYIKARPINTRQDYFVYVGDSEREPAVIDTMQKIYLDCTGHYLGLLKDLGFDKVTSPVGKDGIHSEAALCQNVGQYLTDFLKD